MMGKRKYLRNINNKRNEKKKKRKEKQEFNEKSGLLCTFQKV